MHIQNITLAIS